MDNFVFWVLGLSLLANAYFLYQHLIKKPVPTADARQLLSELTKGKAILEVKLIDPAGLFYRSPRG